LVDVEGVLLLLAEPVADAGVLAEDDSVAAGFASPAASEAGFALSPLEAPPDDLPA
jgi:hypothetical protein